MSNEILDTTGTKQYDESNLEADIKKEQENSHKHCSICKASRYLHEFYQTGKNSGKLRAECKYCLKERKNKAKLSTIKK